MGSVYRPRDLLKGRRGIIERGLQDVSPGLREAAIEIIEAWDGKPSEEKLTKLIGRERARSLLESLKQ